MGQSSRQQVPNTTFFNHQDALKDLGFTVASQSSEHSELTLLDDDDWAIWQSGQILLNSANNDLMLFTGDDCLKAAGPKDKNRFFWWDLASSPLATNISQQIDVRAVIPKYSFNLTLEQLSILNQDEKTVVRLELRTISSQSGQNFHFINLRPLRGYQKEFQQLQQFIEKNEAISLSNGSMIDLLSHVDLEINIPTNKPFFDLSAQETTESAVTRMAIKMLQLVRYQEPGIIDDIDTEFVHQYRVNIRKTRSLISLFKKALTPERYQQLKVELKDIGSRTNSLRDLDVFLLDHDYYRNMLPQNLWPGFATLFNEVRRLRKLAVNKVIKDLSSDAYLKQISQVLNLLQQPADLATKQSGRKIKELASQKILSQYQQIQSDGADIDEHTTDEAVHDLRIECKKLRYLLELFTELYAKDQVKALVKQLKRLQDNLGRFNDYSVQQEFLLLLAQRAKLSTQALASLNGLTAVLYNKQRHERSLVVSNINHFNDQTVAEKFTQLFQAEGIEGSES